MSKNIRRKILIVDDEPSVLNSLKRTLRKEYDVILSQDGFSAIQVLNEQEIAVIIDCAPNHYYMSFLGT